MENNKVNIIISARDAASGVINSIISATRGYHKTLQDLNGTANAVSHTLGRMFLAIGGTALFGKAISAGFQFNSVLEDTRAGLAGLVYSMNEFRDAQGNVVNGATSWSAAMNIAKDIQDDLRVKALQTAASYEELIFAYNQGYAPGKAAKMTEKQISDVSAAISQAAIALRGPEAARMLGEEMRSVLGGQMKSGNTILKPLIEPFLSNEQIRELGKSGKLYEPLMKALEGVQKAAAEASKNFSVALSNMKDAASQALGEGMQAGFEKTKSIISDTTNSIMTLDAKTGKMTFNPEFLSLVKKAGEYAIYLVDAVIRGVKALNDFRNNNPVLVDLIGYFGKIVLAAFAFNAIIRTIGGTWIWMAAQGQANIGMIVALCGNWISVLKTVNIQTIATAGAMTKFGVAAGMAGAYIAGWEIGSWISKMELGKKTMNEWVQSGISYFMQFLSYIKKVFSYIPAYASYAFSATGAVLKSPFMGDEAYRQKQQEIEGRLKATLADIDASYKAEAANQKVIRSMYGEVDAGKKVAAAADKAKNSMNGLTMSGRKFAGDTEGEKGGKSSAADSWAKTVRDLQTDIEKALYPMDEFEKKLLDINNKYSDLIAQATKGKFATAIVEQWKTAVTAAELEKERLEIEKKASEEILKVAKEQAEARIKYETYVTETTMSEVDKRVKAEQDAAEEMFQAQYNALVTESGLLENRDEYLRRKEEIERASAERIRQIRAEYEEKDKAKTGTYTEGLKQGFQDWLDKLTDSYQQGLDFAKNTADTMKQAFEDFFFDPMKFSFEDFGNTMRRILARATTDIIYDLLKSSNTFTSLLSLFGLGTTGNMSGILTNPSAGAFGVIPSARGNVLYSPALSALENSIVNRPYIFPMAKGYGVIGEGSKAEGVLPLARTASGDLGVQTTGGGGNVIVHMNVNAMDAKSFNAMMYENKGALTSMIRAAMKDNHPGRRG